MRKSLFILSGIFLSFLFQKTSAQSVEYPPLDVFFIIGSTPSAPTAGTNTLILLGTADWNVRLYRGRLKQPMINDGSGIYYTKVLGSDTLILHGDTWHTGELVQLEFYKANGTLELGAQYLIQVATFVEVSGESHWPHNQDPGNWLYNNGNSVHTSKKFTGDGYIQFKVKSQNGGGMYQWLQDESGNAWSIEYHPTNNGPNDQFSVYYNDNHIGALANSSVLFSRFLRLRRTGTTITFESCTTADGTFATFYTFPQSVSASQGLLGGGFTFTSNNGATDCKIAGQSLVLVYD